MNLGTDDSSTPRHPVLGGTLQPPPSSDASIGSGEGRQRRRSGHGRTAGGGGAPRSRAVGAFGERAAARHLEASGLVVVDRNWRCELGELDLVAVLPADRRTAGSATAGPVTVVACEVKTRTSTRFGRPHEQITAAKATRLRHLARRWVEEHPRIRARAVRVDVIGVQVPASGAPTIEHLVGVSG